jgi:anthranilate synthase component 2
MLLMIDNYDSFTYNLVHYFGDLGEDVQVVRNDAVSIADVARMQPARIVISPGPGAPDEAGISLAVLREFAGRVPILGVCLGHQAIGQAFGARVVRARRVMHGKTDTIEHDGTGLFAGLPKHFDVVRYHSLAIEGTRLPAELRVTASTADGEIMGVAHATLCVHGVQFHPESIESAHGHALLRNFLALAQTDTHAAPVLATHT